jgi:hypothetical protein
MRRAIFWVDPGGTTGVAWGIFDDRADTVIESMQTRTHSGSATIHHGRIEKAPTGILQGIIRKQVKDISTLFDKFLDDAMKEYSKHGDVEIEFCVEHFVLTAGKQHRPGVEGIFPAFMIGAIVREFSDEEILFQTAAKGMKWHTRAYHTKYNTWVVGKEHEREAWAHVAARLHEVLR